MGYNMSKDRHPSGEIEVAMQEALERGWTLKKSGKSGHAWGRLYCPESSREGCIVSVWSTPRDETNHANQIRRQVERCPHGEEEE